MTTYRAWNLKPLDRSALKELTAAIAQQSTEELESRAMETMDGEPWSEEKYQMTLAARVIFLALQCQHELRQFCKSKRIYKVCGVFPVLM